MCYPVCGMVHIKEPLLLINKSSLCCSLSLKFVLFLSADNVLGDIHGSGGREAGVYQSSGLREEEGIRCGHQDK